MELEIGRSHQTIWGKSGLICWESVYPPHAEVVTNYAPAIWRLHLEAGTFKHELGFL
jgi:hypothetical protein